MPEANIQKLLFALGNTKIGAKFTVGNSTHSKSHFCSIAQVNFFLFFEAKVSLGYAYSRRRSYSDEMWEYILYDENPQTRIFAAVLSYHLNDL